MLLCSSLADTRNKKLELTVFPIERQLKILFNNFPLGTAQPEYVEESSF